jgi:hypothetical protein
MIGSVSVGVRVAAGLAGFLCVFSVLLDAFITVILPRRAIGSFRLTRVFYISTWTPWRWVVSRVRRPRSRETMLSFYGPLSLVVLIALWAFFVLLGFGLWF